MGLPVRPVPARGGGLRDERGARLGRRAPHGAPVDDGPLGEGSLQQFVDADFEQHYFTVLEDEPRFRDQLEPMCAFDLVVNNTDRKSGHVLLGPGGHLYGIDNGLASTPSTSCAR